MGSYDFGGTSQVSGIERPSRIIAQYVYNACWVVKRAQGRGHIQRIEGLAPLLQECGSHVCELDLLPIGAPRRNWQATLISDGMVFLRYPDLDALTDIADLFSTRLQMYAA